MCARSGLLNPHLRHCGRPGGRGERNSTLLYQMAGCKTKRRHAIPSRPAPPVPIAMSFRVHMRVPGVLTFALRLHAVATLWRSALEQPSSPCRGADRGSRRLPGRDRPGGQRSAGAALRQPQIRSRQCARRPRQGPGRGLGLHPPRPAGGNHRRIRELAAHSRPRRHRGLGLPLAAVGQAHGLCHQSEGPTRSRAAL